jgi:glycosyltransferase involved in cell wall biosynthesis
MLYQGRQMTGKDPLVSIVIPTYNRAVFVQKAVDSVLYQTFIDYELIVVDDGSTDDTRRVLRQYGNKIKHIYQCNAGVSAARNTGIAAAKGQWLAFLDSDDEWKPEYLSSQINVIYRKSAVCMQSTNCRVFNLDGSSYTYFEKNRTMNFIGRRNYISIQRPFSFIVTHWPWQVGSTIFRRDAINRVGGFDTKLTISEDLEFMARVSLQGSFGIINKELVNIHHRNEAIECLTNQLKKDPIGTKKVDDMICTRLKLIKTLQYTDRRALNKIIGRNRRGIGTIFLRMGNKQCARKWYKSAMSIDPSIRSIGRYFSSYLPTKDNRS